MCRVLSFLKIAAILIFFYASCRNDNHKGEALYYYYPKKNVYYDSAAKTFFYSLNGAKTWSRFVNSNNTEPNNLGEKVVIFSADNKVFKDNETHRKLYAGALYDISTGDTNTNVAGPEISERKVIQKRKPSEVTPKTDKKIKTGINKLIDKIFGKHHKK